MHKNNNKFRKRGIHTKKRTLQLKIAEFLYPSMGFKAWWKYTFTSLKRKPFSSHKLALGFSFGVFISFTPFIGLHGFLCIIFAKLLKASIPAALLGSFVGNPWTFPLIWAWSDRLGHFILHDKIIGQSPIAISNFSLHGLVNNFADYWHALIYPMLVGGTPTGIVFGVIAYIIIKYQIDKYRQIRAAIIHKKKVERRLKNINKIKDKITEKFGN